MADLITMEQLTARIGDVDDHTEAAALIEDASALLVDIVLDDGEGDDWDAETPGTVPRAVVPVVVAMVRRGLDNPHGFESESQQGYSYRGASQAGVFARNGEARIVRKAAGRGSPRSIDLTTDLPLHPRNGAAS